MQTTSFVNPTPEQRQNILQHAGESERLVKELERKKITTLSRSKTWELERLGLHPERKKLGANSVAWLLSDLLWFIHNTPTGNSRVNGRLI